MPNNHKPPLSHPRMLPLSTSNSSAPFISKPTSNLSCAITISLRYLPHNSSHCQQATLHHHHLSQKLDNCSWFEECYNTHCICLLFKTTTTCYRDTTRITFFTFYSSVKKKKLFINIFFIKFRVETQFAGLIRHPRNILN